MHGQEARDFTFSLALKYHGYSISAQSYDFYLYLAKLDYLNFTMYHIDFGMSLIKSYQQI